MRHLSLLISSIFIAVAGYAKDEFGCLDDVRVKYPDFFKPGVVSKVKLNQEAWYVYCGEAEKCLKSETDDELYEEAQVQAKMNFFNHFSKKDPGVKVDVVGARRMYQCADNVLRLVVMGVPVKSVTIKPSSSNVKVATHEKQELKGDEKQTSKRAKAPSRNVSPSKKLEKSVSGVEKLAPTKNVEKKIPIKCPNEEISDDEKLKILSERLLKNPNSYRIRMRMARIFAKNKAVRQALNNYNLAARLLIHDLTVSNVDKAANLFEIAQYEEFAEEYSLALKHYRMILRLGIHEFIKKANPRVSALLLGF